MLEKCGLNCFPGRECDDQSCVVMGLIPADKHRATLSCV